MSDDDNQIPHPNLDNITFKTLLEDSEISEILTDLDITLENIYHFKLVGDIEIIGEVFSDFHLPTEDFTRGDLFEDIYGESLIINPIKILRDSWINEDGYNASYYFVEWNPFSDSPYVALKEIMVISKVYPNEDTLRSYLYSLRDQYYPNEAILVEDNVQISTKSKSENNVIDFQNWKFKSEIKYL
jgi:hypothetical protein